MADQKTTWQEIRRQKPMNERRVAIYERLMVAQQLIAETRARQGVSDEAIMEALAASDPDTARAGDEDLFLSTLARYVAALGGRLELQAVFPEETVIVFGEGLEQF